MKNIVMNLLSKSYNSYDKWSYIKIKERKNYFWIDNIHSFRM